MESTPKLCWKYGVKALFAPTPYLLKKNNARKVISKLFSTELVGIDFIQKGFVEGLVYT